MTPVGWFISAALVVIGGIAYAAVLLNVPLLAVAAGVIGALAGVFLLVTHRARAPLPVNTQAPVNTRPDPSVDDPAPGHAPDDSTSPALAPDEPESRD